MRFNSRKLLPFEWSRGSRNTIGDVSFRWLSMGSGLNSAGMQGEQVIVGLLVYQLTGSSAWVGVSLALYFAPMFFVGVPAGALADRIDRRRVLISTEIALAVALAAFAMLLLLDQASLTAALVISMLSGSLRALHHPARLSYTGDIAADSSLVAALGMLSVVSRSGQLFGALLAGTISQLGGFAMAYAVLAIGHVLAVWCFIRTRRVAIAESHDDHPGSIIAAIAQYWHLLRSSRVVVLLIGFASLIEIFGFSFATALPEIAVQRLSLEAGGLGAMHAARAAGGLCGALLLSALVIRRTGRIYTLIFAGFGLALMLLAIAPSLNTVLLTIAIVAIFASSADILVQGMLQLCVPQALRGRAMGAWVVALGMGPLGHLELGVLIGLLGTGMALFANGVLLLSIGVIGLFFCRTLTTIRND